jgi:hypothetical protein
MVIKLIKAAEKNWLKLRGRNQLPKLITGVKFVDGGEVAPVNNNANIDSAWIFAITKICGLLHETEQKKIATLRF